VPRSLLITILIVVLIAAGVFYRDRAAPESPADELNSTAVTDQLPVAEELPLSGVDLEALDRNTRPQDDFYQFVNGGWLDHTEIPEIYSGYTVYHQVREDAEVALRRIIENAAANRLEHGSESQQVGDIYNSWMDVETINAAGIEPIRAELDRIAAIDTPGDLVNAMADLKLVGVAAPYSFYVSPDMKNSSAYTVYFNQSGLTMPNRNYYIDTGNENFARARDELPVYMANFLVHAGMEQGEATAAAKDVYELEKAIARAQWDSVDNRSPDKTYNPYPAADLDELGVNFDWTATREILGFAGEDKLIIRQPSYFSDLDRLVVELPLDTWKNYLTFRLLDSAASNLDETTAAIRFDYRNRILYGQQKERPRWKRGISKVNGVVGEAVGKLYVAEFFPREAKEKMKELVDNVITTLDESLEDLEWLSEETRIKAKQKLAKFTPKIGYPDEWKDYSKLEIIAGDHLGNMRRAIAWDHQQDLDKLGTPVDKKEWFMTPQTVNAYYSPTRNEIVFPAARLQPPFFQLNADDAINYGAVGGVIGHEISHGFDDKGSKFDGDGNLVNWWTEQDREAFEERTAVLVEQFAAFEPVEGMNINGELTLGENIGDLSGIAMAYRAYIRSLDGVEPPVIDGFTGPQRFFIGYAISRKGKYREEAIINRLASDSHSPLKYRVNGPYRNIDAFHAAFDTKEGDGMWLPPDDRVKIW
jgi:endothelin-converting enzyme/putative endopeptidase